MLVRRAIPKKSVKFAFVMACRGERNALLEGTAPIAR